MRNQKGITLVALVITIIVLLILAGVSISLVLGQNGVLTNASNAVVQNERATALQEVQMAASDAVTAYYSDWTTNQQTKKSSAYTQDVFEDNCTSAKSVTLTNNLSNVDTGTVTVEYVTNSNVTLNFSIDVSNGKVTGPN